MDGKVYTRLLVLVNVIFKLRLAELIEGDNDQSHEDVDKEEREDNKEHNVENALLGAEPWNWTLILICG